MGERCDARSEINVREDRGARDMRKLRGVIEERGE